ncbi:MAG: hypothetical protein HQL32_01585 [Planctomycetes bacterium]|nr:hypothetical protein [Planctomycetota bacterium]
MADDYSIKTLSSSEGKACFKIHMIFTHSLNDREEENIIVNFTHPAGETYNQTYVYQKAHVNARHSSWIIKKASDKIIQQLKAEGVVELRPRLKDGPVNTYYLNPLKRSLNVDVLDSRKSRDPVVNERQFREELPRQKAKEIREEKKKGKEPIILLDYKGRYKTQTEDENNPVQIPRPRKKLALNPLQGEINRELSRQPVFPFAKFKASGFTSLYLLPSLSWDETDPRNNYSFHTSFSILDESNNYIKNYNRMKIDGQLLEQSFGFSARLWQRLHVGLRTNLSVHESEVELDIDHPTAAGGTTFLKNQDTGLALGDTVFELSNLFEVGKLIFRPGIQLKFATGSTDNLTSSGHSDYSVGTAFDYTHNDWHLAGRLSMVKTGHLNVFAGSQQEYDSEDMLVASLGFGKMLDPLRGDASSLVLNFATNPLRSNTLDPFSSDITTVGYHLSRSFKRGVIGHFETSIGLSTAAPDFNLALSLTYTLK